jgi:hypothetical protein
MDRATMGRSSAAGRMDGDVAVLDVAGLDVAGLDSAECMAEIASSSSGVSL